MLIDKRQINQLVILRQNFTATLVGSIFTGALYVLFYYRYNFGITYNVCNIRVYLGTIA